MLGSFIINMTLENMTTYSQRSYWFLAVVKMHIGHLESNVIYVSYKNTVICFLEDIIDEINTYSWFSVALLSRKQDVRVSKTFVSLSLSHTYTQLFPHAPTEKLFSSFIWWVFPNQTPSCLDSLQTPISSPLTLRCNIYKNECSLSVFTFSTLLLMAISLIMQI